MKKLFKLYHEKLRMLVNCHVSLVSQKKKTSANMPAKKFDLLEGPCKCRVSEQLILPSSSRLPVPVMFSDSDGPRAGRN